MQFVRFEKTMEEADHTRFYEIILLPQPCEKWQIIRYYGSNRRQGGQYRFETYSEQQLAKSRFETLFKQRYKRQYHPVLNRDTTNHWQWEKLTH